MMYIRTAAQARAAILNTLAAFRDSEDTRQTVTEDALSFGAAILLAGVVCLLMVLMRL